MKSLKNPLNHSFLALPTFIEYHNKLLELKASLHLKKSSVVEARKILDTYIKPPKKLSDDVLKMREE